MASWAAASQDHPVEAAPPPGVGEGVGDAAMSPACAVPATTAALAIMLGSPVEQGVSALGTV
jgi:hypothetical protein